MISKKKVCDGCLEDKFIWKNHEGKKYCVGCWNRIKTLPIPKKQKPIVKISKKRKSEASMYSSKRLQFLTTFSVCQANIRYICTHTATQVHHKRGRTGDLFLDDAYWLAVCHECHEWIELHPKEAKELGLSESRLNI